MDPLIQHTLFVSNFHGAARCIRYHKQSYHFPELHKGDIIEVHEGKDQIDFAYLGNVVQRRRTPLRQHTATTRKVQTGGLVKFKQQRMQLDVAILFRTHGDQELTQHTRCVR